MFTGIIKNIGSIKKINKSNEKYLIDIKCDNDVLNDLSIGSSISVNGICFTAIGLNEDSFSIEAVPETINNTTLEKWQENSKVNLELSMKLSDRLDGHIVQGHIDGIARLKSIIQLGDGFVLKFDSYSDFYKQLVKKGSISIDGVSLTIKNTKDDDFEVAIIPHTFKNTICADYIIGTEVNVEVDILGKYISKFVDKS